MLLIKHQIIIKCVRLFSFCLSFNTYTKKGTLCRTLDRRGMIHSIFSIRKKKTFDVNERKKRNHKMLGSSHV